MEGTQGPSKIPSAVVFCITLLWGYDSFSTGYLCRNRYHVLSLKMLWKVPQKKMWTRIFIFEHWNCLLCTCEHSRSFRFWLTIPYSLHKCNRFNVKWTGPLACLLSEMFWIRFSASIRLPSPNHSFFSMWYKLHGLHHIKEPNWQSPQTNLDESLKSRARPWATC